MKFIFNIKYPYLDLNGNLGILREYDFHKKSSTVPHNNPNPVRKLAENVLDLINKIYLPHRQGFIIHVFRFTNKYEHLTASRKIKSPILSETEFSESYIKIILLRQARSKKYGLTNK